MFAAPRHGAARAALFAKGRLPAGAMNRTEEAYALVLRQRLNAGEILWWKFEGIKLRLATNTFLTVDFAVMASDGVLEMHDVKGSMAIYQDDAKAKTKVAAASYPFRFFIAVPRRKRDGGGFDVTEVPA